MVIITEAEKLDIWQNIPATWRGCRNADGSRTATVACPGCGRVCSLSDHTIAADGNVTPSVDCPYDDCTFHDSITLLGWATPGRETK